jgi:hypothetical protein
MILADLQKDLMILCKKLSYKLNLTQVARIGVRYNLADSTSYCNVLAPSALYCIPTI